MIYIINLKIIKVMKKVFTFIFLIACLTSCKNNSETGQKSDSNTSSSEPSSSLGSTNWTDKYDKVEPNDIPGNPIQLINEGWMLITAGKEKSFNSMTASWGAFGEIWETPASFIMVKDSRYTYQFLETNETYTLSFFSEDYRGALKIMGTKSGRDTNKIKEAGLTPIALPSGDMSFTEAYMIVECRKIYAQPFDKDYFIDKNIFNQMYDESEKSIHTQYIGEITNVWMKK